VGAARGKSSAAGVGPGGGAGTSVGGGGKAVTVGGTGAMLAPGWAQATMTMTASTSKPPSTANLVPIFRNLIVSLIRLSLDALIVAQS
jgi:hypothetical protein